MSTKAKMKNGETILYRLFCADTDGSYKVEYVLAIGYLNSTNKYLRATVGRSKRI